MGRVFQCPLAEVGALPSPVFAVYLHVMMIVVVTMAMMMTMVMMYEPHYPWVIYNDLKGCCSMFRAEEVGKLCTVIGVASQSCR